MSEEKKTFRIIKIITEKPVYSGTSKSSGKPYSIFSFLC
ncbi:unnamed protein product, partial [marine sediment metagenome]